MYNLKITYYDGKTSDFLCDSLNMAKTFLETVRGIQDHVIIRINKKTPGPVGLYFRKYMNRGFVDKQAQSRA